MSSNKLFAVRMSQLTAKWDVQGLWGLVRSELSDIDDWLNLSQIWKFRLLIAAE